MNPTSAAPAAGADPSPAALLLAELDGPEAALFAELVQDWHARVAPVDAAERLIADGLACLAWRRRRLDQVEERVLVALARGAPQPGLPSLGTLGWRRRALEREASALEAELDLLRRVRPRLPARHDLNPDRLEWLARKVRAGRIELRAAEVRHAAPEPAAAEGDAAIQTVPPERAQAAAAAIRRALGLPPRQAAFEAGAAG